MPRRDYSGWLGWQASNFGIRRRPGWANQALTLKCCANRSPIFIAKRLDFRRKQSVSVVMLTRAFWPRLGSAPLAIPPLWGFGGDGACAVATERTSDVATQHTQQDK